MSFDTLAFVKRLAASGMDSRQAEALAEALNDIVFDSLTTKTDLRELELGLRSDLKQLEVGLRELELRLRSELKELEIRLSNSLTARMAAMIGGSSALVVGVLGALKILS